MITFLLSGLWHGANWNFILWGGYHGFLILTERFLRKISRITSFSLPRSFRPYIFPIKIVVTFIIINAGWLFFRETEINRIAEYLTLSPLASNNADFQIGCYLFILSSLYALPLFLHGVVNMLNTKEELTSNRLLIFRPVLAAGLLLAILTMRSPEAATFIYFQF